MCILEHWKGMIRIWNNRKPIYIIYRNRYISLNDSVFIKRIINVKLMLETCIITFIPQKNVK